MSTSAPLIFLLVFVLWAALHTLTAMPAFKQTWRRAMGERAYAGLYRLLYNILAGLTFLPVLWLLASPLPAKTWWAIPRPGDGLFRLIQLVGVFGLTISLWQTDFLSFTGIRQALRYLAGESRPEQVVPFIRNGPYALVRHPLYFFSLLALWFAPTMTLATGLFNILATLYFWLGSLHEERRLLADYGDDYRRYRQEVPAFIPFLRFGKRPH